MKYLPLVWAIVDGVAEIILGDRWIGPGFPLTPRDLRCKRHKDDTRTCAFAGEARGPEERPMLNQLVVFIIGEQRYALPLTTVQRVVRMVEVTPLPKAPEVVLGVIDVQGSVIPVVSMRKRFGSAEPESSLSDQLIVADTGTRTVALVVNSVIGVMERTTEEVTGAESIVSGAEYVEGITRLEGGMVFVHDLHRFLSKQEEHQLDGLMTPAAETTG